MPLKISEPDLLAAAEALVRSVRKFASSKPTQIKEQLALLRLAEASSPYSRGLYLAWLEKMEAAHRKFEAEVTAAGDPMAALQTWRSCADASARVTLGSGYMEAVFTTDPSAQKDFGQDSRPAQSE